MKILLLTWDYPPARGGIQVWMLELARRLPDAQVTVIAPAAPGDARFDSTSGCRVRRVGSIRLGRFRWLVQLTLATMWACITDRPDLIACGHVLTAPPALLARRVLGIPYAVFTYGWEIRRRRWRPVVRHLLRGADTVLACSRFTRTAVLAHGVAPERVTVLYPGVEPARPGSSPVQGDDSRARRGMILSVGRLNELYKGHDTVIRALPLIQVKCPGARYVIVGGGRLRDYLGQVARSVGVERDVVFAGEVSDAELERLYRSADVVVQLSRESVSGGGAEGFGIVCLEAGAFGKPIVAGHSGGLVDAVADGETGLLVDPLDLAAVAEALVAVLRDPDLARRLGDAGRRRVLARFTWDAMAMRARQLFAEVAGRR